MSHRGTERKKEKRTLRQLGGEHRQNVSAMLTRKEIDAVSGVCTGIRCHTTVVMTYISYVWTAFPYATSQVLLYKVPKVGENGCKGGLGVSSKELIL